MALGSSKLGVHRIVNTPPGQGSLVVDLMKLGVHRVPDTPIQGVLVLDLMKLRVLMRERHRSNSDSLLYLATSYESSRHDCNLYSDTTFFHLRWNSSGP